MSERRGVHRYRRAIQLAFLVLFFVLLTLTVWPLGRVYLGAFLLGDPLIATNSIVNGVWKPQMLLAVVMLALPLVLGRVFCGYACPLGTLIEITGGTSRRSRLSPRAHAALRKAPPLILAACAGLLMFATGTYLVLDPLSTLTRTSTLALYPLLDRSARLLTDLVALVPGLAPVADGLTTALSGRIVFPEPLAFSLQLAALVIFGTILALSALEPRLWCRDLCPLGALLGLVGRAQVYGRVVDADACISCGKCSAVCPMDAIADDYLATDGSRCQLGLECADICPVDAIGVGSRPAKRTEGPSRRAVVGTFGIALAAGFLGYTGLERQNPHPFLVRPPGSRPEDDFLALCCRCGQCMKTCPTNVLQPGYSRTGVLGAFTPVMDFRTGFCDWSCSECGKVCPTGAIEPLTLEDKRANVIGRAYIDRNRCIPWVDAETCLVCQELCPIPDKAIRISDAEVIAPDGGSVTIGRPEVIADRCIGCGVCENVCPVPNESAILVRNSAPESAGSARA